MAEAAAMQSDVPVVQALQRKDPEALSALMNRYGQSVRGVAFAVLGDPDRVDDVCQQTWATAWEQAPKLREPARWRSWLFRLARNAAIDVGREKSRQRATLRPLADDEPGAVEVRSRDVAEPAAHLESAERHAMVLDAIQSLPALYREPFVLKHLQGWSYRQIGEMLDLPVDTVETRLVRARKMLRETLHDKV